MRPITDLIPILDDFKKIVITTHANPDADALGSSLGLFHFLKARGHEVQVITPTDYPNFIFGYRETTKFLSSIQQIEI